MKKIITLIILMFISFFVSAQQQPRYALVIGNSNYKGMSSLSNPVNDADDMAASLKNLGFSVQLLKDTDLMKLQDAVSLFKNRLSTNPDAIGMFYYAGHGVQSQGQNFLIPVDADIPSESYLQYRSFSVQILLDELNSAGNNLNMIILDACRDNPFGWSRSGSRGLSVVGGQPAGSIVVYATSAGTVAQDGMGRNGLFTSELLKHLRTPGLEISEIFRKTGAGVSQRSGGRQIPAIYNQYFDTVVLKSRAQDLVENIDRPQLRQNIRPVILAGHSDVGSRIEAHDIDNNGFVDVIANKTISYNQAGMGFRQYEDKLYFSFSGKVYEHDTASITDVSYADFDNDGDLDRVITSSTGAVLFNQNSNSFSESNDGFDFTITASINLKRSGIPDEISVTDFNNDGFSDFIAVDAIYKNVFFMENLGKEGRLLSDDNRPFSYHKLFDFNSSVIAIESADFDDDGDIDIIVNTSDGEVFLAANNGIAGFSIESIHAPIYEGRYYFSLHDFDNNGDQDVLLDIPHETTWLMNDGSGKFSSVQLNLNVYSAKAGDFDDDGDVDMLYVSVDQKSLNFFERDGEQFYSKAVYQSDNKIYDCIFAEINNKPGMEIVYTVEENGDIYILEPWDN